MTRAVGSEGKGIQCTQGRAPLGSLGCCQAQRGLVLVVTCFVLALVFRPVREISIDTEIEISRRLSLEKGPKKGSTPPTPCVYVCFPSRCRQFQQRSFSRKIFKLYHILVKRGPKLMSVPGPDYFLDDFE